MCSQTWKEGSVYAPSPWPIFQTVKSPFTLAVHDFMIFHMKKQLEMCHHFLSFQLPELSRNSAVAILGVLDQRLTPANTYLQGLHGLAPTLPFLE